MKTFLLIFLTLFSIIEIQAQESNEADDDKVYRFVQQKAEPKQGMFQFLQAFTSQFN